jgi:hypothetical protein
MRNRKGLFSGFVAALLVMGGLLFQHGDVSAATLKSRVELRLHATLANAVGLSKAEAPLESITAQTFANGTGAGQANVIWSARRTVNASTTEDLDFAGGGLTDAFGVAVAPAKIRAVIITSSIANVQNMTLFGDANSVPLLNTAATTVTLQPGGMYVFTAPATAGVAVTAATGDIIQVANGAGVAITYDIVVIGTSS